MWIVGTALSLLDTLIVFYLIYSLGFHFSLVLLSTDSTNVFKKKKKNFYFDLVRIGFIVDYSVISIIKKVVVNLILIMQNRLLWLVRQWYNYYILYSSN